MVVLGCGFAGYSFLRRLSPKRFDLTLVSPRNYFLFTPLLPSAVTGSVEFRSIAEAARRRLKGVRVVEGRAVAVDWNRRQLLGVGAIGSESFTLPFDHLVVAVGAEASDFGVPGVREHALFLAELQDARRIRTRLLEQFARAGLPDRGDDQIRRDLTFVVCGGGPTGVEVAAEIHDLVAGELARTYRELAPRARVVLVEAGSRILSSFDGALCDYTISHFAREGIELRLDAPVLAVTAKRIELRDGTAIDCGLVVWAAGTRPPEFVASLGVVTDARGRLRVDERFRVVDREGLWALGDCAAMGEPPLPATAQVAQQQGMHLVQVLEAIERGRVPKPFRFRAFGMLAYVGGGKALADLPRVKWTGRGAWFFWRSVYITKLVSLPNKVKVLFDWLKARLFGRDLTRF